MKNLPRILFALAVFLSGAALVPFVGLPSVGFHWQRYANAYNPVTLEINHPTGQAGSFFSVTGSNYPVETDIDISINGTLLGAVHTNSSGDLAFLVDTTGAEDGYYYVSTSANNQLRVIFILAATEPLRPPEGSGPTLNLPPGIALIPVYLPFISK